ncbi:MAG: UDP-N-acetyl-D-mannosamine dehydrogenase [Anaerolineales bacterium]
MEFQSLCVLGLGYIGLPTASTFANQGLKVRGVDVNQRVVDVLRAGNTHIHEPGLRTLVQAAFHSGNLTVEETPAEADAFIIAVPTPFLDDKRADLHYVMQAAESIVPHLRKGNLVILESTCPPRTTVDRLAPVLEQSGLRAGQDFHLAYSPERVLPGQILRELIENARVIGGVTADSAQAGRDLYRTFVRGEILLTDATTAEMVKLMENTYRDVNIALANEFSRLAQRFSVDVWSAIDLANRHPRVEILRPGPGVGGHCIGVDPWFLVEAAPEVTQLIQAARRVNDSQPEAVVEWIEAAVGGSLSGVKIAALGLAYKADVDDVRESPAVDVVEALVGRRADVRTYEPIAAQVVVEGAESAETLDDALEGADVIVLLVDHQVFRSLDPDQVKSRMAGRVAVDLRGAWPRQTWRAAGFDLYVLGAGDDGG